MSAISLCPRWAKNLILCAVGVLVALAVAMPCRVSADEQLGAIDYLDYVIQSPEYVWADDDVVVVSSNNKLVFFTDAKIYQTELKSDGEIMRSGNSILYFHDSLLFSTEIGVFTETPVTDASGTQITANSFSVMGNRLLVINSSGAVLYEDLVRKEPSYSFDSNFDTTLLRAAKVFIGKNDYYSIGGEIYSNGAFLKAQRADYMTELNGELYYSNKEGIFRLPADGSAPVCVYASESEEHSVKGICAKGDSLLFIDETSCDLMQLVFTNGETIARKYVFDVEIKTDLKVEYNAQPTTVHVSAGTRRHTGILENGCFTFLGTTIPDEGEDLLKLGDIGSYALVYGHSGYALIGNDNVAVKDQNNAITFEKGVILRDCDVYTTCVANAQTRVGTLKKGAQVSVGSMLIMNGVKYSRVSFEGGEGFILTGEVVEELLPSSSDPTIQNGSVTGKDNTLLAIIAILLSTGIFIITMFILLVKKEYVKL